jgi:putative endonuclease
VAELVEATVLQFRGVRTMGFMYILECADGTYYTGSTKNLERRLWEHNNFLGANYTRKKHPVKLVYFEEYQRIDEAFYREKQVQGWSHAKKKALIELNKDRLIELSRNYTQYPPVPSTGSVTATGSVTVTGSVTATGSVTETTETPGLVTEDSISVVEAPKPATEG